MAHRSVSRDGCPPASDDITKLMANSSERDTSKCSRGHKPSTIAGRDDNPFCYFGSTKTFAAFSKKGK